MKTLGFVENCPYLCTQKDVAYHQGHQVKFSGASNGGSGSPKFGVPIFVMSMSTDRREYMRKWREAHPGYNTEYSRKWREEHRERFNERCRQYQERNREAQQKRMNNYHQTKEGRATNLLAAYVQMDLERRGVRPNLTREDIMRICFSEDSKCVFCQTTDWKVLGLDRIDNSKPHDASNCLCCCHDCNVAKYKKTLGEFIKLKGYNTFEEWLKINKMWYAQPLIIQY